MNISATFNGQAVRIVNINSTGNEYLVSYIDSGNKLNIQRGMFPYDLMNPVTSATIALSASGS